MMKKLLAAGLAALALLGAGCIFSRNDYVENAEFDLELPKRMLGRVRIGVFKNLSGSDRHMLVRRGDGQVVPLEYQRWRLPPELLLLRCIFAAIEVAPDKDNDAAKLNAVIYRFEFDERDGKAHFAVDFPIPNFRDPVSAEGAAVQPHPVTIRCDEAVAVKDSGDIGAARAAAMSECARRALEKLSAAMNDKRAGGKK